ncbi:MAG: GNAT family N-acetyltransferase [Planctomycetes bacterium]|nr:GNAT family N-acetyltransferase [Planctomycetota bacterium]
MKVAIRTLDDQADRRGFHSGAVALDEWLLRQAGRGKNKRSASVWIAFPQEKPSRVIGCYCLAPWQVGFKTCPEPLRKQGSGYPFRVLLLSRLGVASSQQGKGLGGVLLVDALRRAWVANAASPIQAVVAHAEDDQTVGLYQRHGLIGFRQHPQHFFLPMKSIARLFATHK